jgi:HEAT repeat protein
VAGSVFDARQAKRLFPLCTGAAIAGSFLGTLASGPVARAAGTELLIVIEAILLAIVALVIVSVARTGRVRVPARRQDRSVVADLRLGLDEVARSPLFRLIALAYVLFSILYFSVTYPFLQAAASSYPNEADLATAIGLLSAAVTATSFVISLTIANRVYARFGVAGAALALPLVYLAGFGLWLVQFSFATAALVRFTQQVTQRGLSNATWSAFYNVIPSERRAQVLAFMDGVPSQIGMILSGLLLLGAGRLYAADQLFWLGAVTAIAATVVVLAIRRRYGASLLRTLRTGLGEQVLEGGPGLAGLTRDPQVIAALNAALQAPEPAVRRMAVSMLAGTFAPGTEGLLVSALDDVDPGVRIAALNGLASPETTDATRERLIARLSDPDDRVRAAAVRALVRAGGEDIRALLVPLEEDPSPPVRAVVAVALDGLDSPTGPNGESGSAPDRTLRLLADPAQVVRECAIEAVATAAHDGPVIEPLVPALLGALDDESPHVRRAAAALLAGRPSVPDGLVKILTSGTSRAQEAALLALLGHGPQVHNEVVAWAEAQIARATDRRASRLAVAEGNGSTSEQPDTAVAFLEHVLERRERQLADLSLGAFAVLGIPEARGVIRRCLRSGDPETRAQAMEAIDSIGDRRLGGAIVRFLDADAGGAPQARDTVLDRLADDDDPWVRSLARRTISDAGGTVPMPEAERTSGDIDTMLMLRRVPLFEQLDPEDLQRIAATTVERSYVTGAALMREGELGDELLVIVEGSVRVIRAEPDGSERLIRRFQAGDHIGELAVLRERPRVATVIAEGDGVRALVIGGEGLKAILHERPEAAMAMLATLAERISAQ